MAIGNAHNIFSPIPTSIILTTLPLTVYFKLMLTQICKSVESLSRISSAKMEGVFVWMVGEGSG